MSDKISVIIPAYNVENYIEKCVNSVLNQSYKNIEIIIVVNGSTDNTKAIVNGLAEDNDNIVVIVTEQSGVSNARNIAIARSTGKYIMFLDSDDYYDIDMVINMHHKMVNYNIELCICNYSNVYQNGDIEVNSCNGWEGEINIDTYMKKYAEKFHTLYFGVLWNKIYIAEIIKDNNITFNKDISLGEDSLFNLQYLRRVKRVYAENHSFYYHYRDNTESLTKITPSYEMWDMAIIRYQYCIETYKYMNLLDECRKDLAFKILSDLMIPVDELINDKTSKIKETTTKLKSLIKNQVVDFGYQNLEKLSLAHKIIKITRKSDSYLLMTVILKIKSKMQKCKGRK